MEPLTDSDPVEVGRYRLSGRLGSGGMGVVYLGRSPGGRLVAVKVVHAALAGDRDFRVRFRRELEAVRRVGGFHTAHVVDAAPDADPPWLVTTYVSGPSLARALEDGGPLPEPSLRVLGAGLAEALEAIHAAGLVHRDLKPSNILLADDGPRVIDFGIARALDGTGLTGSSTVLGTPAFMAPEQIVGAEVGPPCDVFALGLVLCFAVGRPAFGEGNGQAVMYRIVNLEPDLGGVPSAMREVVAACLAKEPSQRPAPSEVLRAFGEQTIGASRPSASAGAGVDVPRTAPASDVPMQGLPAAHGAAATLGLGVQAVPGVAAASGSVPSAEQPPIMGAVGAPRTARGGRRRAAPIVLGATGAVVAMALATTLLTTHGQSSESSGPGGTSSHSSTITGSRTGTRSATVAGRATGGASTATTPTPATPALSGSSPTAAGSGASGGPAGAASTVEMSPSPGRCRLLLTISRPMQAFTLGVLPTFTVVVQNQGTSDCTVDLGAKSLVVSITSAGLPLWSSADCGSAQEDLRTIAAGGSQTVTVSWPRVATANGCPGTPAATVGTYVVRAALPASVTPLPSIGQLFQLLDSGN
jgi:hypothetical protein